MTQPQKYNIALIGCGKMGSAMIQGWIKAKLLKTIQILDPHDIDDSLTSHPDLFHVKLMESLNLSETDIVILAVKPQIIDSVCQELSDILPENIPLLSIAAGKSTSSLNKHFSDRTPIIRTMPNTPAAIGMGISALYATSTVNESQREMASALMSSIGDVLWIDDELHMDSVTALSGSGPAYIFYMIEAMATAGEKVGLSKKQATQLARQTVIGAAALADTEKETTASTLRENVTSPEGTTEAALKILMDGRFDEIMTEAILAAKKRGEELNQ